MLNRTTRSQHLTSDGQAYYDSCLRALAELDAAETTLDRGRREPRGRVRVSAPLAFGHHYVAPVLLALARTHPQLRIDISITDRMIDLVEEGVDLAVRIGRLRDSTSLAARRVGTQYGSLGAAPSYVARHGTPAFLDDLARHPTIAYAQSGIPIPWEVRDPDGQVRRLDVGHQLSFDDVQAIASAAVSGHGIAWLPSWLLAHHVKRGELVAVMDLCLVPKQDIHILWPRTRYLPLKTRCAIDALVAAIPALIDA